MAKKRRYVSEVSVTRVKKFGFDSDREQSAPRDVRVQQSRRVIQQKPEKKSWFARKKRPPEDEFLEVLEETHK